MNTKMHALHADSVEDFGVDLAAEFAHCKSVVKIHGASATDGLKSAACLESAENFSCYKSVWCIKHSLTLY